ncbi:MAG TPA: hypothetical protein VE196_11950, partial [Pseudonocardiaceae bacterium]|nr:hypothetical protein [Pseudonocardiaceae bacterium]
MARGVENDIADLMARLRRVNSNGDATPVLAPEAMAAVCRIILSAPSDPDRLVGVASLLIAWHLARAQVVGDGADVTAAVELRALMARLDRSEVPPEWLPVAIEQVAQRPNAALHPAPASGPALLVGAVQFQGNALFDQVIEVLRLASRTAGDAEGTVVVAANLASALQARYRRTGDQTDLAEAIGAARRGVAVESASAEARAMCLLNLATVLAKSFEATQRLEELSEAVERNRAALAETRVDDPMHSACGYNLALLLRMRYLTTRTVDDLEEALTLLRAVIAAPSSGQYLAHAHHERSVMLGEQFEHTHDPG